MKPRDSIERSGDDRYDEVYGSDDSDQELDDDEDHMMDIDVKVDLELDIKEKGLSEQQILKFSVTFFHFQAKIVLTDILSLFRCLTVMDFHAL